MGTDPHTALQSLRTAAADGRLDALAARHRLQLLTVFGSTARGAARARDLDVAVRYEPDAPPRDVLSLLDDLAVLTGSDDVDLLVLDDAGPVARERALVACVALYESRPGVYARAQMAAMCERMETDWLRRLDLQLLAT